VLLQRNDFVIIDFEASRRAARERRAKHSPLRDVAGMLRSFDYARWAALRRAAKTGQDLDASRRSPPPGKTRRARRSSRRTTRRSAARASTHRPSSARDARPVRARKALYELRYELGNRPDGRRSRCRASSASRAESTEVAMDFELLLEPIRAFLRKWAISCRAWRSPGWC
jgi:maltose alpha-D-glucosyltransferase/alpha-amylase